MTDLIRKLEQRLADRIEQNNKNWGSNWTDYALGAHDELAEIVKLLKQASPPVRQQQVPPQTVNHSGIF